MSRLETVAAAKESNMGQMVSAINATCPTSDPRLEDLALLVEVHQRLTTRLEDELERRCGLPLTWFDVLIRLARTPERRMTMTELARELAFTSGGVTRLVDRMAQAGLVERVSCPSDRRSVYVALTPAGAERLEEAVQVQLQSLDQHLVGPLGEQERRQLRRALQKLLG